ncbi:MAG: AbrB/MazE/SpoVT family DNA-binding domain-containing protein [Dehalococcoidia bacterium]
MKSTVTRRGQTIIPSSLRRKHDIQEGMTLEWIDTGETIKVIPVPGDPVKALRGTGRGEHLLDTLLASRKKDRDRNE